MQSKQQVYIQLRDTFQGCKGSSVLVKDLAVVLADVEVKEHILNLEVLSINKNQQEYIVVSVLTIIEVIYRNHPNTTIIPIGSSEILVKILNETTNNKKMLWTVARLIIVCAVLFVGTGLAIMNFHADVNMAEAHQVIYKLLTGTEKSKPYIIQIPYSLGIGLGMAIFFNHILPKKYGNQPSPMEIEMFSYRKGIDEYLLKNEKNTEENA